ncbi:MAG: hypothetical protein WC651_00260 [Candidatus Gracilibacteria bacterium]
MEFGELFLTIVPPEETPTAEIFNDKTFEDTFILVASPSFKYAFPSEIFIYPVPAFFAEKIIENIFPGLYPP